MYKYLFIVFFVTYTYTFCQTKEVLIGLKQNYAELLIHKNEVSHLANYRIKGVSATLETNTTGEKAWHSYFNFPNYGLILNYQDMGSPALGEVYSLSAFYKFFFLKRQMHVTTGLGFGFTNNRFDAIKNPKNIAYGSSMLANVLFELNYRLIPDFNKRINFDFGLFFQHFSNAKIKSPNSGTNHYGLQFGVSYNLNNSSVKTNRSNRKSTTAFEPDVDKTLQFHFLIASGLNDLEILNTKPYPFFTFTALTEKKLSFVNSIQLGADLFLSYAAKEYNQFMVSAYPEEGISRYEDWKRVGLFAGHKFHLGELKLVSQLGYYIYYPIEYLDRVYTRIGLQYTMSKHIYASILLKSHYAKAESLELGIGFKL
ncbi:acyloxyacyl hydrolase [Psychroflexus sp. ALD_RP9]|uniref:acyloxyacyl hydrolase n=1 Tax=Psychroflexus sp. ALD_RP9 TaxID=2777186 RepID=UPI001A8CC1BE|nr:acyloxyacyl hydrolase [Psychroflexus sp. ALD_RP9]QSS96168.1 acyloxyacyl hydrolase [Psychroflexus sp. ALD_RP9]